MITVFRVITCQHFTLNKINIASRLFPNEVAEARHTMVILVDVTVTAHSGPKIASVGLKAKFNLSS